LPQRPIYGDSGPVATFTPKWIEMEY